MSPNDKKRYAYWALDNLEDCMWQTVKAIADTDSPEVAANLSVGLDQLDTGQMRVRDLLNTLSRDSVI